MTSNSNDERFAASPPVTPDLRLRGERPRVTRLSRKVLIGMAGVVALAIASALGYALQPRDRTGATQELYNTQNRPAADGLANLPKDYTGLPRPAPPLGPPLPGDLGRPILNAGVAANTTIVGASASDPEAQRRAQEGEAARVSRLFAQTSERERPITPIAPTTISAADAGVAAPSSVDAGSAQNMQDRKTAFLTASTDRRTVSPDRLTKPASPYIVQAGTVIPAALITGLRSDLPGQITAQVTEAVYDSPTGKFLLIPQGAKLIGQYDSSVAYGQRRVLLAWTRLIMPNGTSIVLERQPGADAAGYAGLEDEVDDHWDMLLKGAALSTFFSVGAEAGTTNSENSLIQAIRRGGSNSASQTGQLLIQRQLNVQPTLTIRPGFPVRVLVTRDLLLAPYKEGTAP
ncbi:MULTISPECIES: TrbI/VirB10 family protein [Methylosinus]|jgi:type IV secretory pathway VirB10-like protein|uniref:Conjugal transfer protein TraI n=1 Tax=Methylosinus trichosporium (strain ATCC 35070 / NCIMB 11131 / UNIQEM 75 / OB3b) TaxID=595536 RepID=A0A2D2D2A5_METT3|nr:MULTISPECIES: TrbI/VirB10 family protein [Methylosinus]ATQ68979.1 conjugal transfer protein TraI [Methylosinus trichosporium OB3b]ATQ69022.1 conjugal transfer protein TraI [Methylosinus trichosporium OB3b]OBS51441.1 conjugal transfer protein TraI [Methylosinus sp. 3S-1]